MGSSEAAGCGQRMFQTPNTCISQTELVNGPETAQQGYWKHHAKQAKNQTLSTLKLKDQQLHFPAERSAQQATGSSPARGLLCEQKPPLRGALLGTSGAHSGQAAQHGGMA